MSEILQHELDDGAHEVVDVRPQRKRPSPVGLDDIVRTPAGGNVARMQAAAQTSLREFILMRRPHKGPVKMALGHARVFKALVRVHAAKRLNLAVDPGCTTAEIAEASALAADEISNPLTSLVRNGLVRRKTTHVGWQGARSHYYPTTDGAQALALAEVLPYGSSVQIGKPALAFRARHQTEPTTIFEFADLIRRQGNNGGPR